MGCGLRRSCPPPLRVPARIALSPRFAESRIVKNRGKQGPSLRGTSVIVAGSRRGLTAAYELKRRNAQVVMVEARAIVLGGRVWTKARRICRWKAAC